MRKGGNLHCLSEYGFDCATRTEELRALIQSWWDNGEKNCPRAGNFFTAPKPIPTDLPKRNEGYATLRWELDSVHSDLRNGIFELEIQKFADKTPQNPGAYRVRKPRLTLSARPIHLRNINLLLNGQHNPLVDSYTTVDRYIARQGVPEAPADRGFGAVLSSKSAILIQQKDVGDELTISFETLERTSPPQCHALDLFNQRILPAISARGCFECHGGGSENEPGIPAASQRFSMAGSQSQICAQTLQRVDFHQQMLSPFIDYSLRGVNGHARLFTSGNEILPRFREWLSAEKAAHTSQD